MKPESVSFAGYCVHNKCSFDLNLYAFSSSCDDGRVGGRFYGILFEFFVQFFYRTRWDENEWGLWS